MPDPSGELVAWEGGIDLVLRRRLPFSRERVWRALVEETGAWFSPWQEVPDEDGSLLFEGEEPAAIVECQAPATLLLQFGDEEFSWRTGVTLAEVGGGATDLSLTHGFEPDDGEVDLTGIDDIAAGWEFYLDRLAALLNGDALPEFEGYPEAYGPHYLALAERAAEG